MLVCAAAQCSRGSKLLFGLTLEHLTACTIDNLDYLYHCQAGDCPAICKNPGILVLEVLSYHALCSVYTCHIGFVQHKSISKKDLSNMVGPENPYIILHGTMCDFVSCSIGFEATYLQCKKLTCF